MIATLGDLVEDVVVWPAGPLRPGTDTPAGVHRRRGGSAANVAWMAARAGGTSRFIGSVGDDEIGTRLVGILEDAGVDVVVQRTAGATTGTIVVVVDPLTRERSFFTDRGACDALVDPRPSWLDGVTALHVPAYSFCHEPLSATATSVVISARSRGIPVSIDASSTGALGDLGVEVARALLRELEPDVLLANREEARLLGVGPDRPAEGPRVTIVKDGADPTTIVRADGRVDVVPVPRVEPVVDTTGAGDGFAAGWLVARAAGADPLEAVAAGHALAARVLAVPGADLPEEVVR